MKPLLTTGLNGLVGSKLAQLFQTEYQFENLDLTHPTGPVDITQFKDVLAVFEKSNAEYVVHFAAYTDVTGAWKQTNDQSGPAYQVNVVGTRNIVQAAAQTQKKVIHISTSYIFDGKKTTSYREDDTPSPLEWYGQTKALAEAEVTNASIPWTILRIDQPFRSDGFARPDLVRRIATHLRVGTLPPQFTDHYIGPTYIDDFARVIDWVIRTGATGIFNASSGEKWSDFDLAKSIQSQFQLPGEIKPGFLSDYLKTTSRPYQANSSMDCSKLHSQLDFKPHTVIEALKQVNLS